MNMDMERQILAPRVELGQATELRVHLRPTNVNDGLACCSKQDAVVLLRTIQRENVQLGRGGEDHLQVRNRQDLLLTCREPLCSRLALTERTTSITT